MNVKTIKERWIEDALVRRVHAAGGICEKVTTIGYRGFFDRLVILPGGKIFFVELKRPRGGRMSAHQIQRHKAYRALGGRVEIILNVADIDRLIKEEGPAIS